MANHGCILLTNLYTINREGAAGAAESGGFCRRLHGPCATTPIRNYLYQEPPSIRTHQDITGVALYFLRDIGTKSNTRPVRLKSEARGKLLVVLKSDEACEMRNTRDCEAEDRIRSSSWLGLRQDSEYSTANRKDGVKATGAGNMMTNGSKRAGDGDSPLFNNRWN